MGHKLNSIAEAKEYFERAAKTCQPGSIILYHNQRKSVLSILKDAAEKAGKILVEKDLTLLENEKIGTSMFENKIPKWIEAVFDPANKKGTIFYMREFHYASDGVKNDAMNLIINMEIEGQKFPPNTLVILGVLDTDDMTASINRAHNVMFYREM